MLNISHNNLKRLAALVWLSGGLVLSWKCIELFTAAQRLKPDPLIIAIATAAGLTIGIIKLIFIFNRSCRRNLNRIEALPSPQIWQVFRPGFLVFLGLMIIFGQTLSNYAIGKYGWLIGVGIIDLSLAVGLLGSSHIFWKARLFSPRISTP